MAKTKTKPDYRSLCREATTWPTCREIAEEYGLSLRTVRTAVEKGYVEAMRLDALRIRPESWEAFLASRHRPAH